MTRISFLIIGFLAIGLFSCSESPQFEREQELISFHENVNLQYPATDTLRVATFNMQLGFPDSLNPFNERNLGGKITHLDKIIGFIQNRRLDIVFLQEVARNRSNTEISNQIAYLGQQLDFNYAYADDSELGSEAPFSNGFTGLGILTKFPIQSSSAEPLIRISRFRGNSIQRVTILIQGRLLNLINCHFLAGATEEEFGIQQNELLNFIERNSYDILGGDFNAGIGRLNILNSQSTNILNELPLPIVESIFEVGTFGPGNVIDHLYVNLDELQPIDGSISPSQFDFLSDHNSLEACLVVGN